MTSAASYYLGSGGVNPTAAGVELPNSRRLVYVSDVEFCRVSYGSGGLGECAVQVRFSGDGGSTWGALTPYGPTLGVAGSVLTGEWSDVVPMAMVGELLVSAWATGSTLLGLGLYSLTFVELQVR